MTKQTGSPRRLTRKQPARRSAAPRRLTPKRPARKR